MAAAESAMASVEEEEAAEEEEAEAVEETVEEEAVSDSTLLAFLLARAGLSRTEALATYRQEVGQASAAGSHGLERSESHEATMLAHAALLKQASAMGEEEGGEADDDESVATEAHEQEALVERMQKLIMSVELD